jgi:ATP diphosphatase
LARHLKIDPETALRRANAKFERRFRAIEAALAAAGERAEDQSLDDLEDLWQAAKRAERQG